jgi:N-methylhydantoinase B
VYRFSDAMDGDGVVPGVIPIAVAVTKRGDSMSLDFAGSGPQCEGDINVVYFALLATVYYALKAVLDPSIPANGGFYRAIRVTAPEGSIVNARPPAPVAWRTQTCQRIADVVLGALAQVVPERVPAAGNGANCAMVFSGTHPRTGALYVYLETLAGGAGATAGGDGLDAVQVHVTNTSNLPVEALESEYPLLVNEYALVEGSGGAGRHRGGLGLRRTIEVLDHEARFLGTTERAQIAPWGLCGGEPGGLARLVLNPGGPAEHELPPKVWGYPLRSGDRVAIDTPGAGGYGPPVERALADRAEDERSGIVGRTTATPG